MKNRHLKNLRIYKIGLNQQLYDMGVYEEAVNVNSYAGSSLARRKYDEFDLVMISEKIKESLVLLADYLCWPLNTVAIFYNDDIQTYVKV